MFRLESIRSHESSRPHLDCLAHHRRDRDGDNDYGNFAGPGEPDTVSLANTPIALAMRKLNDDQRQKLTNLFTTAYMLAKHGKPMYDMYLQCELLRKIGVNIGENYQNNKAATEFVASIAAVLKKGQMNDLHDADFISVLADGSADVSIIEIYCS